MPNDQPETIAAILAKYRRDIAGGQFFTPTQEYILRLLDRIEAAAERERNENEAKVGEMIAFVKREMVKQSAPGNASSCAPMSLDEAIKHAEERADGSPCGQAHAQLAGWLRELRDLRRAPSNTAALREAIVEIHDIANTAINQIKGE